MTAPEMKKDEELFRLFKEETRKYLKSGRSALEQTRNSKEADSKEADSRDADSVKTLYKSFHEIKNMAGMFDKKMIYELSLRAETALLPAVKDGKELSKELDELISKSLATLERLTESL